jgi:hypothetical protein
MVIFCCRFNKPHVKSETIDRIDQYLIHTIGYKYNLPTNPHRPATYVTHKKKTLVI